MENIMKCLLYDNERSRKNRYRDFYGVDEAGFTLLFSCLRFASRLFFLLIFKEHHPLSCAGPRF
ncbi:hypothetical protein [Klebsiella aerogenes]|uniref:hypothetical protein n=1 Tax=Klebsiella aerogenes TaxID=548 RepID=UPI0013A64A1F|nr:hypothetical protein [Klebsiella aerogenes]HCB2859863.1 hypothetical protein [Klebsiella aerogenes]HCB2864866.1 hypothetical protein [Klebsiella aerogenes]HCB2881511.1 hypothetical protein [Klebsiella aerogenes]HCB3346369.1 hypothetical protein [Klebsiella aerogenes]HCM1811931.1 hypothetical protein [Klebsiella aerogenes]